MKQIGFLGTLALLVALLPTTTPLAQADKRPVLIWEKALYGTSQELRWPVAVAGGPGDHLAVADAHGNRLVVFGFQKKVWQELRSIPLPGTPAAVTAVGKDFLVTLRHPAQLVKVAAPNWSLRSLPLPDRTVPGAITTTPDGTVLIYDLTGDQVLKLPGAGPVTGTVPVKGYVAGLAGLDDGGFLASHPDPGVVIRYRLTGEIAKEIPIPPLDPRPAWPTGLAALTNGQFFVVDPHAGRILLLDPEGRQVGTGARAGWDTGLLRFPTGVAILPGGWIAVADRGNGRVQLFHRSKAGGSP